MQRRLDVAKFLDLSGTRRRSLIEAVFWLGVARLAILTIPFRWTTKVFGLSPGAAVTRTCSARELVQRVSWAVKVVSARSPWRSTCLAQALAGAAMLRRHGIRATLVLGVAKAADSAHDLEAHAWLFCDDFILTGDAGREKYSVVARFTVSPG